MTLLALALAVTFVGGHGRAQLGQTPTPSKPAQQALAYVQFLSGTGTHGLQIPRFDPALGTLLEMRIVLKGRTQGGVMGSAHSLGSPINTYLQPYATFQYTKVPARGGSMVLDVSTQLPFVVVPGQSTGCLTYEVHDSAVQVVVGTQLSYYVGSGKIPAQVRVTHGFGLGQQVGTSGWCVTPSTSGYVLVLYLYA